VGNLTFKPLMEETWPDFEALFGEKGACGGCWCMVWRLPRAAFVRQKGRGNKAAMKKLVGGGEVPGLLAYAAGQPVGWCSVAAREHFPALQRSRILGPLDGRPVWSVTCFFIAKPFRRQGLTVQLLRAAIGYVRRRGGRVLEGYPVEPKQGEIPGVFAWTGLAAAFRQAGFVECLRRSDTRPIMRYEIKR